ncbi:MAG: hypothetical protein ACYC6T_17910 [Thermoleophilia bacterium]
MVHKPILLGDLALACYTYNAMTGYGRSLRVFQEGLDTGLDLSERADRLALLHWLNSWGCRNLACAHHELASDNLAYCWNRVQSKLPAPHDHLAELDDHILEPFGAVFHILSELTAARRTGDGRPVSFGPTAASKTLFVLRPDVFVPWDARIRQGLGYDKSGGSYVEFLKVVRSQLRELAEQCELRGFSLEDLPERLGRPRSTPAQLVGEYHWITITREVRLPPLETLQEWFGCNQPRTSGRSRPARSRSHAWVAASMAAPPCAAATRSSP